MSNLVFHSNQIKYSKPLLAKSIFFSLLSTISIFFLYYFVLTHDWFFSKALYLFSNSDLLRDPKIFFVFFVEIAQFTTFSLSLLIFSLFAFININSLFLSGFSYLLNDKIGPIHQPLPSVSEFLEQKK